MYPYHHTKTTDRESVTVFMPSGPPIVATAEHPHFADILEGAKTDLDADELRGLADLSVAVAQHFDTLSERVAVASGRVYFDGDEVDSTITKQIVRCLEDPSVGDWKPLVLFMENIAANPIPHSREQLFDWLRDRDFTITNNGCFIAYKGVNARDEDAEDGYPYESSGQGEAIVNGERFEGRIPNGPGATVEMPRSSVQHDPEHACSTGLHVGTYEYAQQWAKAALLTVLVNPRDVVSVPNHDAAQKMRVCRYVVSDDEATPPSEGPAVEGQREPGTLYPAYIRDNDRYPTDYYIETGERRCPQKDEFYLFVSPSFPDGVAGCAAIDYSGADHVESILVPTKPIHGDWTAEDGGRFWLDCPAISRHASPGWCNDLDRDPETFIAGHEDCEAH